MLLIAAIILSSCSSDDNNNNEPDNIDETKDLILLHSFSDNHYTIDLFGEEPQLKVGYNSIFLRVEDADGNYVENADLSWHPMMEMHMDEGMHHHSCPHSDVKKVLGKQTLYQGYVVFNMASDGHHHMWEMTINYKIRNEENEISDHVNVLESESDFNRKFMSAMGTDGENYMLAYVEPAKPEIGPNNFVVALFKAAEDGSFPIVNNYKIQVDPRMPGMGNHSAPGNEDLVQKNDGFYHGKVGFSMTGYWKLNLILLDDTGNIVKGEPITEQNESSSLYFELEF